MSSIQSVAVGNSRASAASRQMDFVGEVYAFERAAGPTFPVILSILKKSRIPADQVQAMRALESALQEKVDKGFRLSPVSSNLLRELSYKLNLH